MSHSRRDSRKLCTMMATPIMAVSAMPSAALATPVRLSESAMSPHASRATGLTRAPSRAAARARTRNAAGVTAATLNSSMNSVANPASRLRPETHAMRPAATASSALTRARVRATRTVRVSSTERASPSCGALAATSSAGSSAAASAVASPAHSAVTRPLTGTVTSLTVTTKYRSLMVCETSPTRPRPIATPSSIPPNAPTTPSSAASPSTTASTSPRVAPSARSTARVARRCSTAKLTAP